MGNKSTKFGIALALGAAAGYVASLFVSDKTKQQHKGQFNQKIDELATKLLSDEDKKRAQILFKNTSSDAMNQLQETKSILAKHLVSVDKTLKEIDKKKYLEMVKETIKDLTDSGDLNKDQLAQLKTYLEEDYEVFKSHQQKPSKKKSIKKKTKKKAA